MTYSSEQTTRQFRTMVKEFIGIHYHCDPFDAIRVARDILDTWGIRTDWHDVGDALEHMCSRDYLQRAGFGPDRMAAYTHKA